jgi:multicomponent Na+:H+ antiporter subunit B
MKHPVRFTAFIIFGGGVLALFCWALVGLDRFGEYAGAYGIFFNSMTVPLRHATNVSTAINFDFRGFDTIGEEYILFASVCGTTMLLRSMELEKDERGETPDSALRQVSEPSDAIRLAGLALVGLLVMFGTYVILHGHLTPGGGFQGGVIVGSCTLVAYLTTGYTAYAKISPIELMEAGEAIGAGAFVAIGLCGLILSGSFLYNFLPLGTAGQFASAGTITLINDFVGLEVASGFAIIFHEFIVQTLRRNR